MDRKELEYSLTCISTAKRELHKLREMLIDNKEAIKKIAEIQGLLSFAKYCLNSIEAEMEQIK